MSISMHQGSEPDQAPSDAFPLFDELAGVIESMHELVAKALYLADRVAWTTGGDHADVRAAVEAVHEHLRADLHAAAVARAGKPCDWSHPFDGEPAW